jgi:hypothetical protein
MFPVVALAVLGACSAADEGDWPEVDSNRAQLGEGAMALEVELQAALLRDPKMSVPGGLAVPETIRTMLQNWDAYVGPACIALAATVDADRDGIPAAGRMTIKCVQAIRGAPQAMHVTGVVRLFDLNDRLANDGYRIKFENLTIEHGTPGAMPESSSTLNGDVAVMVRGSPPSLMKGMKLAEDLRWEYSDVLVDGTVDRSTYAISSMGTYMPDPVTVRMDPLALGVLRFEGQSLATRGFRAWTTRYWTDPPLHWNRKCELTYADASGFDRGAVIYEAADGVQGRIVFEGCI